MFRVILELTGEPLPAYIKKRQSESTLTCQKQTLFIKHSKIKKRNILFAYDSFFLQCFFLILLFFTSATFHQCYFPLVLLFTGTKFGQHFFSLMLFFTGATVHWCYYFTGSTLHWCYCSLILLFTCATFHCSTLHWCYFSQVLLFAGAAFHWLFFSVLLFYTVTTVQIFTF